MDIEKTTRRCGAIVIVVVLALGLALAPARTGALPPLEDWCCEGLVGDLNLDGKTDITDLSVMIDNQFLTLTPLPCWGEADFDGNYGVDITDLQVFLDIEFSICFNCDFPPCTPLDPSGSLISHTGCKGFTAATAADDFTPDQSCIVWDYDGTGTMSLSHINAGFNCCPTLDISVDIEGGTIMLREVETLGECFCLCLFDLEFEIINLPPGEYRVVAEEPYVLPGMETLDFTIDLIATPSGVHCDERTEYPWGIDEVGTVSER